MKISLLGSLLFFVLLSINSAGYADRLSPEYQEILDLVKTKKYDDAYALLENFDYKNEPKAYSMVTYLLGSGVLSGGQDICGAILNYEKYRSAEVRKYAVEPPWLGRFTSTFNYLYGGDWASIAALEGQPFALYILGKRTFGELYKTSNPIFELSKKEIFKDAYVYFYNSAKLGFSPAETSLDSLEIIFKSRYPEVDYLKLQKNMEFKPVICPVREVARENW